MPGMVINRIKARREIEALLGRTLTEATAIISDEFDRIQEHSRAEGWPRVRSELYWSHEMTLQVILDQFALSDRVAA